jgi:signal transduction histidine kinase
MVSTRFRSPLLAGVGLVLVTLVILMGVLFVGEHRLLDRLLGDKTAELGLAHRRWMTDLQATIAAGEESIVAYADLISHVGRNRSPSPASRQEWIQRFDQDVNKDKDGAWRSRKEHFEPNFDAGIWIPPSGKIDDDLKYFYARSTELTAAFGIGARDPFFGNVWLLLASQGEIEFDPSTPNFIYDAGTDFPYRDSPWMALTEPATNPKGKVAWTPASYDPIVGAWMVSVVAPWQKDGAWAGSAGHDLVIDTLLKAHERALPVAEQDLFVFDGNGLLIASTIHDKRIRDSKGTLSIKDLADPRSLAAMTVVAADASHPSLDAAHLDDEGDLVLVGHITGPGWTTVTMVPRHQLTDATAEQFSYLRTALLSAVGLLGAVACGMALIDLNRRIAAQRLSQAAAREAQIARAMAEEANQVKSRFLANMSHEIRTPMTGIIGMCELLADSPLAQDQKEQVEAIQVSGQNLLAIINDILDLAKIEAEHLDLTIKPVDLDQIIDEVIGLCATEAAKKGIGITRNTRAGTRVRRQGDGLRLRQILFNVLGNAVKFTDQGWVEINLEEADDQIRLRVVDTGVGIPPDQLAELFQPFIQADSSDTRRHGGTGLGLTIAKRLAERMGGTITMTSQVGKGTTVVIDLPLPMA